MFSTNPLVAAAGQLVHVVDRDLRSCQAICAVFRLEGYEVAFSTSLPEARARVEQREPHAIILNSQFDGFNAIEMLRQLCTDYKRTAVVMIQDRVDLDEAIEALHAGAADVIEKPIDAERMIRKVRDALRTEVRVRREGATVSVMGFRQLTPREREVLEEVAEGRTNKEAARKLGISPRTIEVHRARVMQKLGAKNAADLMRIVLAC